MAKFHGVVTCLLSGGEGVENEQNEEDTYEEGIVEGMARFGGHIRGTGTSDDNPPVYFTVDVTDNGEPNDEEDDLILVRITSEPCGDNPEDEQEDNPEDLARLGRGNVKIHNNPDDEPASATEQALGIATILAAAS